MSLTSPATSAGLSPAAASFQDQQVWVPLRDPGPSHSEPAGAPVIQMSVTQSDCLPPIPPHRQRDGLWQAAAASHVTDTHLSPCGIHRDVPLRLPFDTWCITWSKNTAYVHGHKRGWCFFSSLLTLKLLWWDSELTDWAKHQVWDQGSASNGSALFFASSWCLLNVVVMLLREDQNRIKQKVFQNAAAFLFLCARLQKELKLLSWSLWAALKASLKITRLVNGCCRYLHMFNWIPVSTCALPG